MNAYGKLTEFLSNSNSAFKTNLYQLGGYVEVANSNGKVHDISLNSLLSAFQDLIENYIFLQKYITLCNKETTITPKLALQIFNEAQTLNDHNLKLETIWKYYEKPLRLISEKIFTNPRIKVVGFEQTKILFNTISKIISCANNLDNKNIDENIVFTKDSLNIAKEFLTILMQQYSVNLHVQKLVNESHQKGKNIIFYGAPGTGKSYQIDQLTKHGSCIHTVFHADTQYSDFLGMLKPTMNDNNECSYHFMPGPFIQSYVNALKNPQTHHYLVIEEINRAQAAMVFGEIFQLLDRDEKGIGCYEIEPVDQSLVDYLINQIGGYPDNKVKLQMPGNLSIFATMNSSDQAVMPLDTAFKRRWEFEYIQINMDKASDKIINIPNNNQTVGVTWRKLATEINERLSEFNIPEDRHLGPFFLSTNEINEKGLTNKLFIYLWDDLLRHQVKTIIFDSSIRTFGQLIKYFEEKNDIFCPELQQKLF